MARGKNWTAEDLEWLQENWGSRSIPFIAERLNRSEAAIKVKAARLSLGPALMGGDWVSLNQLAKAMGYENGCGYKVRSWVENRQMPVHMKRVSKNCFRVVYLDEFWAWAEKNRAFLDFSRFEPMALGLEPDWVRDQRRKDRKAFSLQRKDRWTPDDDARLESLLESGRYTYQQMSRELCRSCGAIQRRCADLGLRLRPVRESPHCVWLDTDFEVLADGIRGGDSYTLIAEAIGKSEKAVRGKVFATYLTENADKVRAMLGRGKWGENAPAPTVRQSMNFYGKRKGVQEAVARLCGLLSWRRNQLAGWDQYWQRKQCMLWDDAKGCTAGEHDCDSCVSFRRIRPQYCVRCGETFIERQENKYCPACRQARKKAAQRRWARTHKGA